MRKIHVGARLGEARRAASLTQEEVAETVGLSVETIGRVERDQQVPPLHRLAAIAEAVGIDLADALRVGTPRGKRERLIGRLTALLRRRTSEDVEMIVDVAERIFRG